jgi:uncharacterized protein YndB with AHSA1/START domain
MVIPGSIGRVASLVTGLAMLVCPAAAMAAVVNVGPSGFELKQVVHIAAPPDRVYAVLVEPGRWWSSAHTFSGDAANLTLEAKAGGCFCEALPNAGSVRHLTVVMAAPGEELALRGALGPFMRRGVDGSLDFALKPAGDGTDLTLTNDLGGYLPEGFADWAGLADAMLAEQMARLKRFVETGAPGAVNP